jgi:hypothetical protein
MTTFAYADPFMSYPGTRAKAMGGAFVGVADDASTVWYNPAGIAAGESFDCVFEWMQAISQDTKLTTEKDNLFQYGVDPDTLNNDKSKYFFALKTSDTIHNPDIGDVRGGGALYYISPYTIDWYYPPNLNANNKAFGNFREDMNIFGFALAASSEDDLFKYGATFEYINIKFDTDDLYLLTKDLYDNYDVYRIQTDYNHAFGFSGSFGMLASLYSNKEQGVNVKLGGTYRFHSSCSADTGDDARTSEEALNMEVSELIKDQMVFRKPASYDVGLSFSKSFIHLRSAFLFAGQYGITDWTKTNNAIENKYEKSSLGAEWQLAFKNGTRIAFRSGWYLSEATKPEQGWPDVTGLTMGVGFLLNSDSLGLDCTYEFRNISFEGSETEDISLVSIALTNTIF